MILIIMGQGSWTLARAFFIKIIASFLNGEDLLAI
jgi:hypothetical protein